MTPYEEEHHWTHCYWDPTMEPGLQVEHTGKPLVAGP